MTRRSITRVLAIAGSTLAVLAIFAAPCFARFVDYKAFAKFGSEGSGAGQFDNPVGVAVEESTGDVYVVDQGNNRVERFEADGKYLSEFDGSETPTKAFEGPTGVAVDNSKDAGAGRVYVADSSQNVVDVFDASGKYLSQIGVQAPNAVTVDPSGHLWVGTGQPTFEEYSETGSLMLSHAIEGGTALGIAVDSRGNVYVSHANNEKSSRYSPPGFEDIQENMCNCSVALAIDSATDILFQDGGQRIIEWPPFGEGPGLWERIEEAFGEGLGNSFGMTFDGRTHTVYVSDEIYNDVEVFSAVIFPDVTTGAASQVTSSSATIQGSVNPDKTKTTYLFEWGETQAYGNTIGEGSSEGETLTSVSAALSGLVSNRAYHYRMVASNENGTSRGADETFVTPAVPPVVEGPLSSSNSMRSSVVLRATIKPSTKPTNYHFVYVEDAEYEPTAGDPYSAGGLTAPAEITGSGGQAVEQVVGGLKSNTTYHYTVVVNSEDGRDEGTDGTFSTGAATLPAAMTGGASDVGENVATIDGVVNTSGLPSTYGFEIGTSTNYGPATGLGSVGAGLSEAEVSLGLTGLLPGTTYHYRLTVTNVDGTSYGADQTFTTGVFANTFATPPAPLPFVAVPSVVFPSEPRPSVVKKKVGKEKGKKVKKRGKIIGKKRPKNKKKK